MIRIFCPNCKTINTIQDDFDFGTVVCAECEEEIGEIVCGAYQPDEDAEDISTHKMFVVFLAESCEDTEDSIIDRARGIIGRFKVEIEHNIN